MGFGETVRRAVFQRTVAAVADDFCVSLETRRTTVRDDFDMDGWWCRWLEFVGERRGYDVNGRQRDVFALAGEFLDLIGG